VKYDRYEIVFRDLVVSNPAKFDEVPRGLHRNFVRLCSQSALGKLFRGRPEFLLFSYLNSFRLFAKCVKKHLRSFELDDAFFLVQPVQKKSKTLHVVSEMSIGFRTSATLNCINIIGGAEVLDDRFLRPAMHNHFIEWPRFPIIAFKSPTS